MRILNTLRKNTYTFNEICEFPSVLIKLSAPHELIEVLGLLWIALIARRFGSALWLSPWLLACIVHLRATHEALHALLLGEWLLWGLWVLDVGQGHSLLCPSRALADDLGVCDSCLDRAAVNLIFIFIYTNILQ